MNTYVGEHRGLSSKEPKQEISDQSRYCMEWKVSATPYHANVGHLFFFVLFSIIMRSC